MTVGDDAWTRLRVLLVNAETSLGSQAAPPKGDDEYLTRLYVEIERWFDTIGELSQFQRHAARLRAGRG